MSETINYRFVTRRALAATWASLNDLLLEGEYGFERDTKNIKMGDGVTRWNDLEYTVLNGVVTLSIVSSTVAVDSRLGNFFTLALNADATLDITNSVPGRCFIMKVTPSASAELTLPSNCNLVAGGVLVTGVDPLMLGFLSVDGTNYDVVVQQP